jgi:uncharacterized membrane protein
MTIILWAALAVMGGATACIIAMLVSISKSGDERKKTIVEKTCSNSFLVVVGLLVIRFIENIVRVLILDMEIIKINPFTFLAVAAVAYAIQLAYFKKKYGG